MYIPINELAHVTSARLWLLNYLVCWIRGRLIGWMVGCLDGFLVARLVG